MPDTAAVCSCGCEGRRGPMHQHECPVFQAWSNRPTATAASIPYEGTDCTPDEAVEAVKAVRATAASVDTQDVSRTLYGHVNGDYAFLDTCEGMVPPPTVAHLTYIGPTTDVFALLPRRVRQVDIAAQVGVSQQSVSRYVRGEEPNLTDDGWRALVRLLLPVGAGV